MTDTTREAPASAEKRAAALEIVLRRKVDMPGNLVAEFTEHADDAWITANGAQMVARAWTDPEYRACLLTERRQPAPLDSIFRSTIGTLLSSRTRPQFTT